MCQLKAVKELMVVNVLYSSVPASKIHRFMFYFMVDGNKML